MKKDNNSGLIIGAGLLAMGAYSFFKKKDKNEMPDIPPRTILPPNKVTVIDPVVKSEVKPEIKPATVKPTVTPNTLANKWIFIDSLGGERIFSGVNSSKSLIDGYGKDAIMRLPNNVEAGVATGVMTNGMIQVRVTINSKPYQFWIDSTQVKIFDTTQRNFFVDSQKTGRKKTTAELNTIIDFFRTK